MWNSKDENFIFGITTLIEILRPIQEIIFPSIVTLLYTAICYSLLEYIRYSKEIFKKDLDVFYTLTTNTLTKNYLEVVKGTEDFEELFSNPVAIIVFKNFCTVSIVIMDILHLKDWLSKMAMEAILYFALIFGSLGILTKCAADIPLEMLRIKSVLLDKISEQAQKNRFLRYDIQIDLLLKRKVCVLTACNLFSFDRGFLLKAMITVIAQAVVFDQLGSTLKNSE
ncbi:hypothetical protein HNY73_003557 [Argiope bruennichi]|uniref:Uncharacterized protein n=1 Tax=Argiope bruennichi TaxID=94029 RepID=A0A8T0FR01_ARGBR|nr:hypothetical protein HNY73_003557 [Argiope bruennichi]